MLRNVKAIEGQGNITSQECDFLSLSTHPFHARIHSKDSCSGYQASFLRLGVKDTTKL